MFIKKSVYKWTCTVQTCVLQGSAVLIIIPILQIRTKAKVMLTKINMPEIRQQNGGGPLALDFLPGRCDC